MEVTVITQAEFEEIKNNTYKINNNKFLPDSSDLADDWQMVAVGGHVQKYNREMVSKSKKLVREMTILEFYNGGIVD